MADKSSDSSTGCLILFVIVIIGLVVGGASWAWGSLFGGPRAHYQASVTSYQAVNPAALDVTVRVTNTGKGAGDPSCTVSAQDLSDAYKGWDTAVMKGKLNPGQSATYNDNIVITHQGARYVTQVTVSCS